MAKILVVDDQHAIRALLRAILEGAGHQVSEATNGREGLASYGMCPCDLVITDIAMPAMNGLDLILALTKGFLNVKIIAMSGKQEQEDYLDAAKLLGARQTLLKPFSMEKLLSAVSYELARPTWNATSVKRTVGNDEAPR